MASQDDREQLARLPTGVPGLDVVLKGGLLAGGVVIVQGHPGAGKTILGNQLCFAHVARGGRALYVTLLAENHSRMLQHIGQLGFFDQSVIPAKLSYISAFRVLEEDGLKGLLDVLRREVDRRGATLLIVDGLVSAQEVATSPREFRKFVHELQSQASLADCTALLLTGVSNPAIPSPEHTMVDGVIELQSRLYGRRAERDLHVRKLRGTGFLRGEHSFRITDEGIVVYPRTEALLAWPTQKDRVDGPATPTGLAQLDRMTGGGLPHHSTSMVVGPAGVGKTTLGLHFLSQCGRDEPGLHFGFYETPSAIAAKAKALKLPLPKLIEKGHVEILWQPTTEGILDEACHRLVEAVKRRGVRRLFIDGLDGFGKLTTDHDRLAHIFAAFSNEFRAADVTTIYTSEAEAIGPTGGLPLSGLPLLGVSALAENIIIMRYAELRSQLHRMMSVLKVRDSQIDSSFHTFAITDRGIVIDETADHAEAVLAEASLPSLGASREPGNRRRGR